MPLVIGSKTVLTLDEYRKKFSSIHLPPKKRVPQSSFVGLLAMAVILLAVNVLSAGHTIPTSQEFFSTGNNIVLAVLGVAAVVSIEAAIVFLMAQEHRTGWIKLGIVIAFIAALGFNLLASITVVTGREYTTGELLVAIIAGVFPPVANLAFGEVYRERAVRRSREAGEIDTEYRELVRGYENSLLTQYQSYLGKVGFSTAEEKNLIIAGIVPGESTPVLPPSTVASTNVLPSTVPSNPGTTTSNLSPLAVQLREDGTEDWAYADLRARYKVGNGAISSAKKELRG